MPKCLSGEFIRPVIGLGRAGWQAHPEGRCGAIGRGVQQTRRPPQANPKGGHRKNAAFPPVRPVRAGRRAGSPLARIARYALRAFPARRLFL